MFTVLSKKLLLRYLYNKGIHLVILPVLISACDSKQTSNSTVFWTDSSEITNPVLIMPDSDVNYLSGAIDTMQKHSIKKDSINWKMLRNNAFEMAKGATSYSQTYPAIRNALVALEDDHSFFKTPEQHQQWLNGGNEQVDEIKYPEGKMRGNNIAFIELCC